MVLDGDLNGVTRDGHAGAKVSDRLTGDVDVVEMAVVMLDDDVVRDGGDTSQLECGGDRRLLFRELGHRAGESDRAVLDRDTDVVGGDLTCVLQLLGNGGFEQVVAALII